MKSTGQLIDISFQADSQTGQIQLGVDKSHLVRLISVTTKDSQSATEFIWWLFPSTGTFRDDAKPSERMLIMILIMNS